MAWDDIWASREELITGLGGTLQVIIFALITSTALGTLIGILRARRIKGLAIVLRAYVELFRGSPLLVQLLLIYFGLAQMGIPGVSPYMAVVLGLTLYEGAYISEIVRAGIEAIPKGQDEAARTLGLASLQRLRWVVLPQAFRVVLPALISQWIALIKDSSLASVVGYNDLIRQGQAIYNRNAHPFEVLAVVAVIFFVVCSPLTLTARRLERRRVRT